MSTIKSSDRFIPWIFRMLFTSTITYFNAQSFSVINIYFVMQFKLVDVIANIENFCTISFTLSVCYIRLYCIMVTASANIACY
ncbi:dna polymerase [Lasius niger]|uniref:Dna polymerase n=1 Tax=Lasius niger TaxID=67767 RepID=A0A0J7L3Q8_LASNI|nr:dna polymerase [Lasius niger]